MGIPLRVLLVEDSEDDALLLLRELQRFDFQATELLGLRLVKGLTHQLQGNIDFSSNNGAKYKIIFPTKNL